MGTIIIEVSLEECAMSNRNLILGEFQSKPENTLILIGCLYRDKFADFMSEIAFAQAVSRLCRSGEIVRVSKGVYCRPKKTRFGVVMPSEREIIKFFTDGNRGVIVGYGLFNELGVTTQVPKHFEVYSSFSDERLKQICNVTIRKFDLEYSPEVRSLIQLMELLRHCREIEDMNPAELRRSIEALSRKFKEDVFDIVQKAIGYPKWTVAFLREVLNRQGIANNLDRYLSRLSDYSIPDLDEIFKTVE